MMDDNLLIKGRLVDFIKDMDGSVNNIKGPDLFWRRADSEPDQICILRRWNSHTPGLLDVWGGGYFLRWRGHGTIIDPGASFVKLLRIYSPYGLQDVDMVLVTHDHMDHCQDLATLISLLRGYNMLCKTKEIDTYQWDIITSLGVASQFNSIRINPENGNYFKWQNVLPPLDVETTFALPQNSSSGNVVKTLKDYSYNLKVLKSFHRELLSQDSGMGARFALCGVDKTIVISGDTAINQDPDSTNGQELSKQYEGANLLILHVGTMEKPTQPRLPQHLGFTGVLKILLALAKNPPDVIVLTEWGYEFGRLGLFGRSRFTELIVEELFQKGCSCYFAAIEGVNQRCGKVPIIPADLNLRISLPELKIFSEARGWVNAIEIRAKEQVERITFI